MQEDVLKYGGAQGHNETACIDREFILSDSSVNWEEKKWKKETMGRDRGKGKRTGEARWYGGE